MNEEEEARILARVRAERMVESALRSGRISPYQRARILRLALEDPESTRAFINNSEPGRFTAHERPLTTAEERACELFGIEPVRLARALTYLEADNGQEI